MRVLASLLLSLSLVACADTGYYVAEPPPPVQEEVIGEPPYPGAVHITGYWGWEGRRHVWHRGYWSQPRPGYAWHPHRWERRGNRYYFSRGGWRRF